MLIVLSSFFRGDSFILVQCIMGQRRLLPTLWPLESVSSVFQSVLAGKGYNEQIQSVNKTLEFVLLLNFCPPLWLDPDLKNLTLEQRASETQDMQKHLCPSCCPRQYTNSDLHRFFGLTFDKGELRYCGMQRGWTWFKTAVPCTQRAGTDAAQQRIEQTPIYQ